MGHNQRNANRAYRIEKNKARINELATKLKALGKLLEKVRAEGGESVDEVVAVMDEVFEAHTERLRLLERPWWKKVLRTDLKIKEEEVEMPKEEEKKPEPPATPSHRQVVVDRKVPGPGKKEEEPEKTKAESRDA